MKALSSIPRGTAYPDIFHRPRSWTMAVLVLGAVALLVGACNGREETPSAAPEEATAKPTEAAAKPEASRVEPADGARAKAPPAKAPAAETRKKRLRVRAAAHAGSWYPRDEETLRWEIETRLKTAERTSATGQASEGEPVLAMVGPHAGLRFSGDVAAAGYVQLRDQEIERIILLGPSHHASFNGIALPAADVGAYATPLANLAIDTETVATLRGQQGFGGLARAHDPEHSLEMHAIFIAAIKPDVRLLPLVVGRLGKAEEVEAIAEKIRAIMRPGDVVIASSDFTHYGERYRYLPFKDDVPNRLDELLRQAVEPMIARSLDGFDGHIAKTRDTICGREPIRLLLALLPDEAEGTVAANDTSGRMTGDYASSVTYMSALYRRTGGWSQADATHGHEQGPRVLGEEGQAIALRMARTTLEEYLESGHVPAFEDLGVPAAGPWSDTYGTFVTLNKSGVLRGCIGHIFPVQPLWQDIRDNAIAAAVKDRRFPPVSADELDYLEVEISILTHPERVPGPEAFEVGRHGVVLSALGRRAVYLPQVARDMGWDRAMTLTRLARKAGLPHNIWRTERATFDVFEAQVFGEPRLIE